MSDTGKIIGELADREYEWGFVTEIDTETIPRGLSGCSNTA